MKVVSSFCQKYINRPVGLVILLVVLSTNIYAAEEKFYSIASGSTIQSGLTLATQDDKYMFMNQNLPSSPNPWTNTFDLGKVDNSLILYMDAYDKTILNADFEITVELRVSYDTWDYGQAKFINHQLPQNILLKVNNRTQVTDKQKYKAVYQFPGGNRLKVTVISVTSTVAVPGALTLETEVAVERYYRLNTSLIPAGLLHSSTYINSRGELEVTWPVINGAEEYELEWTHMDNYSADNPATTAKPDATRLASQIPFSSVDFNTNATRVTTNNNYYRIPLMYERGYIIYRIRGVGRNRNASFYKNIYTLWSDDYGNSAPRTSVSSFPHKFLIDENQQLNKNLNWQSSVSFAEEGKNKSSVSYFDGSLRNRQTVTKMNTQDEVIAGETVYDDQGRPMVQILPVPVNNAKPDFKSSLNVNTSGVPFSHTDIPKNTTSGCYGPASVLSNTSGAAFYYSPSNTNPSPETPYIPDSKGYPYTQTTYTPDNTGRIMAQSGVGDKHQIGSGHETKYFYNGPPSSSDVNRLFGTEVGNVERYKKNLVIDANGQVSVSYLDAQGRVIATSLAGASPENLTELSGSGIADKVLNVMETKTSETDFRNGATKTFSRVIPVSTKDEWNFDYTIQTKKFTEVCNDFGLGSEITKCYDCVLDIQLLLTDNCGQQYLVNIPNFNAQTNTATVGDQILQQIKTGNYTPLSSICSNRQPNDPPIPGPSLEAHDFTTPQLEPGSYTITRVLSVNEQALSTYLKDYLESSSCLLKLEDFIEEETALNVTGRCDDGCTECLESLGTYDQYDITLNPDCQICLTRDEYQARLQTCKDMCEPSAVDCENLETTMRDDLVIFGQYAGVSLEIPDNPATTDVDETFVRYVYNSGEEYYFPLSVLNVDNKLPQKKWFKGAGPNGTDLAPNWRHPYRKKSDGTVIHYYEDDEGNRDYINIFKIGSSFVPAVVNSSKIYSELDANGSVVRYYTDPENVENVFFFISNWQNSWAKSLLAYHPEYCYLEFCHNNSNSYEFDDRWVSAEEVIAAPVGFVDPIGVINNSMNPGNTWDEVYTSNQAQSIDPYFNPSLNPNFSANEYLSILNRVKRAVVKRPELSGSNNNNDYYNIWQAAYLTVRCPNYEEIPGTFGSCDQSGCGQILNSPALLLNELAADDELWNTFKMMYYSAKRDIVEKKATQFAIKRGCYNGCMGVENFDKNSDGFFAARYRETEVQTYTIPNIQGYWQFINGNFRPGTMMYAYAFRHLVLMSRFQRTVTRTITHFPSQFYNPEQPCNQNNYVLYSDKQKSYMRNRDGVKEQNISDAACLVQEVSADLYGADPTELSTMTAPVCLDDNIAMVNVARDKAAFELYEKCGQCEATKMLEVFMDEVAARPNVGLSASALQLNCYPEGMKFFIKPLEEKFQFATGTGGQVQVGDILWSARSSTILTDKLIVDIEKTVSGNTQSSMIVLAKKASYTFRDPNTGLDHSFSFNWNQIKGICCFESSDNLTLIPPAEGSAGYKFKGRATVEISFDGGTTIRTQKIDIEGYTQKIALTCPPPVVCEASPLSKELLNMWNTILYTSPEMTGVDENGNDNSTVIQAVNGQFVNTDFELDHDVVTYDATRVPYEDAISVTLLSSLPVISSLPEIPANSQGPSISAKWQMVDATPSNKKTFLLKFVSNNSGTVLGQYPFEFEISSDDYTAGVGFDKIRQLATLVPDRTSADPSVHFTVKALVVNSSNMMQYITLKGYSPFIPTGICKQAILPQNQVPPVNGGQ